MTNVEVLEAVAEARGSSELVRSISAIRELGPARFAVGGTETAPVSAEAVSLLEQNGNTAEDWTRVQVVEGFNPLRVRNTSFFGDILLGRFEGAVDVGGGVQLPTGIYGSTLANCYVGDHVLIRDVRLLSGYVVEAGAVLLGNGTVTSGKGVAFGNLLDNDEFEDGLPIAIETGGREVKVYAEITVPVAEKIAKSRADGQLIAQYEEAVAEYVAAVTSDLGVIAEGAVIRNTPKVADTYVGPYALIDGATGVVNSTLLSSQEEPAEVLDGAYVGNSLIQWGCEAASMAIVESSVLTEHSHVERHGKVTGSLVGPNSGVAEGEVTASLLGPFVGFHHQALLIAALWPEGKGNVGYGANVGSNHTSKAPDQEIWPGEGTFFGLGVNIKFPSDFTKAPYSIIATAVNALPQKVEFPFCLINSPAASYPGISPAYNEITPAWLLSNNIFTLKRNEGKFKQRNKARRSRFVFDVFRPDTVAMMLEARDRLRNVKEPRELYTDKDIKGLGKNYMLEPSRLGAIEAYGYYAQYYALLGLKRQLEARGASTAGDLASVLSTASDDPEWEYQRGILQAEFPDAGLADLLVLLRERLEEIARDVQESKEKDDTRGVRIIEDYADAHQPAADDKFVKQTWEETRTLQSEIDALLERLPAGK